MLEKLLCQDSLFTYFKWNCKIILIYICMFFFLKGNIINLLLDGVKLGLKCPVFLWSETHGLGSVGRYPDDDSSWFLSHDENNTLAGILGNGGGLIPAFKFMMLSRVRTYANNDSNISCLQGTFLMKGPRVPSEHMFTGMTILCDAAMSSESSNTHKVTAVWYPPRQGWW